MSDAMDYKRGRFVYENFDELCERASLVQKNRDELEEALLANMRVALPQLEALLERASSDRVYEDGLYRFYYQSFKVYGLQGVTQEIAAALEDLAPQNIKDLPGDTLCQQFGEILAEGASGKKWEPEHNPEWTRHTRPIVEAFLHAKYFLEMVIKFAREMDGPVQVMPFGWAAIQCLYGIR